MFCTQTNETFNETSLIYPVPFIFLSPFQPLFVFLLNISDMFVRVITNSNNESSIFHVSSLNLACLFIMNNKDRDPFGFQGYNSHSDEDDPERVQMIIQRAIADSDWILDKVRTKAVYTSC